MRPDALTQLREVHAIQGRNGCWDIDDYMLGMFNGLELALCIMENRAPQYKQRPEQWGASAITRPEYVAEQKRKTEELRSMLAQPEQCKYGQEPKSCTSSPMDCQCAIDATLAQPDKDIPKIGCVNHDCDKCKAQPEQEPSYWLGYGLQAHTEKPFEGATPVYTTPPQRTWVGLTSVDWNDFNAVKSNDSQYVAAWAESKLKEKNNA